MLVHVDDIRDGRAERAEDRSQVEDVRLGNADALRHTAGKGRTIAAEGEECTFLWSPVNPAEDLSHGFRHHLESGAGNIEGSLLDALAERIRDVLFDDFARTFCAKLARSAQEIVCWEPLQREEGIGQCWLRPSQVVAGRA